MKNFGEKAAWAYPGTSQIFLSTAIISGMFKATNFKFGKFGPSEPKPFTILGENGAWAYPGTAQIF